MACASACRRLPVQLIRSTFTLNKTSPRTPTLFNTYSTKVPSGRIGKKAISSTASTIPQQNPLWTKDDDTMLASLRKKKSNLAQIQIYMPHQPVAAIESRLKELEASASQKPTFQRWTPQEDTRLGQAVRDLGTNRWSEISDVYFSPATQTTDIQPGITAKTRRSPRSCQIRWKFLHSASSSHGDGYNAGPWSAEEVELFQELVDPNPTPESPNNWDAISQAIGTRSPIQCSSQFASVMHTGTKGKWTVDEINLLLEAHELYGRDWQKVSRHVGTRAPPQVRQKWNQFSEDVLRRLNARRQRSAAGSGVIGDDEK